MSSVTRWMPVCTCLLLAWAAAPAHASGARQAVTPRHGEMVLLREVSTRNAYRQQPPGMAVIVDPSPQRELGATLGTSTGMEELDAADYATLGAGTPMHAAGPTGSISTLTGQTVTGSLGRVVGREGVVSGSRLGGAVGAPMGNVSRATSGIADHVRGALAQFPLGQGSANGGGR